MKQLIIQLTLLFCVATLTACSGTEPIMAGNSSTHQDHDAENVVLNLPRAILARDPCKHGHPDDIAACRKKQQDQVDQLNESLKRNSSQTD
ncbi:MAG: hypothetical protein ACJAZA_000600 [Shewanella psychromarinicola]|jgi:hypothetical protein